jgi:hypothetical protein
MACACVTASWGVPHGLGWSLCCGVEALGVVARGVAGRLRSTASLGVGKAKTSIVSKRSPLCSEDRRELPFVYSALAARTAADVLVAVKGWGWLLFPPTLAFFRSVLSSVWVILLGLGCSLLRVTVMNTSWFWSSDVVGVSARRDSTRVSGDIGEEEEVDIWWLVWIGRSLGVACLLWGLGGF